MPDLRDRCGRRYPLVPVLAVADAHDGDLSCQRPAQLVPAAGPSDRPGDNPAGRQFLDQAFPAQVSRPVVLSLARQPPLLLPAVRQHLGMAS